MKKNIILLTDSYKLSHHVQYPKGTTNVYSYFEPRVGAKYSKTTFFGLQYLLKEYLEGVVVTKAKLERARKIADAHVGPDIFNYNGWKYVLEKHKGKLPVRIKAVPEGLSIPTDNVLMTVENTDPKCYWLTNYIESLLVHTWYPSTVATISRETKTLINRYLEETGNPELVHFKLHDFGFRGVSSVESAMIGGGANLINFKSTDTIVALDLVMNYYNSPNVDVHYFNPEKIPAVSIPASEHSTMTSWKKEGEVDAFRNMLRKYPTGLVSVVSDSYDIINACKNLWGKDLKEEVLARDGVLVVRPDSGDPVSTVLKVIQALGSAFGTYINDKGYIVLNDKVRVIQGDGCNYESIGAILENLKKNKISADNITFGMGGGLLQKLDRDTQRFAFKCSSIVIDGKFRDVYKSPKSDMSKSSKRGRLSLVAKGGTYKTINTANLGERKDILETVFENGKIVKEYTFEEVRHNADIYKNG